MSAAQAVRRKAGAARRAVRDPASVYVVDALMIEFAGDIDARFPEPAHLPGVTVRVFEGDDMRDPVVRQALPADRIRFQADRERRGDICFVALLEQKPVGWLFLARATHRDPWSGLKVRLATDEIYCYDLWINSSQRRGGVARYLTQTMVRWCASQPDLSRVYAWVDRENRASQKLCKDVLGFVDCQHVSYARILNRYGVAIPFSDRPRFGPFSRRGRHR
jgi:RimJ/RimL family protein N-acetyltransferase